MTREEIKNSLTSVLDGKEKGIVVKGTDATYLIVDGISLVLSQFTATQGYKYLVHMQIEDITSIIVKDTFYDGTDETRNAEIRKIVVVNNLITFDIM